MAALLLLPSVLMAQPKRGAAPPAMADRTTMQILAEGTDAMRAGDFGKAAALLDAARARPDFAQSKPMVHLMTAAGDFHLAQGTKEEQDIALLVYNLPLDVYGENLQPQDRAMVRLKRAEVMMRQGRADQAREELALIRKGPQATHRTLLYADLGDAELLLLANQASAVLDKLSGLSDSDDPTIASMAMFHLGRAYVQLKQTDQAVATFRKLWNRYGESEMVKRAIFLVGQIYFDRGDFLDARKLYEACAVVGAAMQTKVRPGDELIVKVYDSNYYTRTRSVTLNASLTAPSGDKEALKLEKNPVNDALYVGRIRTALAMPAPGDGVLQVGGGDVIELSYDGPAGRTQQVKVVDDGSLNIDSLPLADPPPRHAEGLPKENRRGPKGKQADARPELPAPKQGSGGLNPGSPVYVQLVDADLDKTTQADTMMAEVVATGGGKDTVVKVQLTETGPRTGIFTGSVPTMASGPTITASSEAPGHPAVNAIDVDRNSPAPSTNPSTKPSPMKRVTFWQAKADDKAPYIEIELHQPAALAKLVWGAGDDPVADRNMPTDMTITLTGDGPPKIIKLTAQSQSTNNVVELKGTFARTIRFDIGKCRGEAPAIGQIVITDTQGNQLIPTGLEPSAAAEAGVLQFNVGQNVYARYVDEVNETPGTAVQRESRRLGARYYNGTLALARAVGLDSKTPRFHPAWRLDLGASPHLMLSDPDLDVSKEADTTQAEAFTESGGHQLVDLQETGPATGVFAGALMFSTNPQAKDNPRILYVREGDLVWARYLDERNMLPGYRTYRYVSVLESRPTAGDWAGLGLIASAAPVSGKVNEDGDVPKGAKTVSKSSGVSSGLSLAISDPDALADAATAVPAKVNALISNSDHELSLQCSGAGNGSLRLGLVLGDAQAAVAAPAEDGGETAAAVSQLLLAGDDILRLSYVDARIPTADLQTRAVAEDEETRKTGKGAPKARAEGALVTPVIHLADPNRRAVAAQDERIAALKDELNARLQGYAAERKLFDERRQTLIKRQAAAGPKPPTTSEAEPDPVRAAIVVLDTEIALLDGRMERLKALGATGAAPAAAAPASQPAVPPATDGPLTPGQPFEIVIDDPDLRAPAVDVRLRSVGGGMIDKQVLPAKRDASGKYQLTVQTRLGDDPERQGALSIASGGEVIVDYQDNDQAALRNVERVGYVAMASDATLSATNSSYLDAITKIRLGEPIFLEVEDYDADRSPAIDHVAVTATSSTGDKVIVILSETEPHSGLFRGKLETDNGAAKADDDLLQASYGGTIELTYFDYLRESRSSSVEKKVTLSVAGGTDGTVEGFSRHFKNAQEEMKLWHRTGQSAYQIGRRLYLAGSYERADEYLTEATDYFSQLVAHFPEDALAASADYYLGNIQSLKGRHKEALDHYSEVVSQWPKSDFVARARFKMGEELEALGYFDQAADAYVLLTYHHPDDSHVPMAMIRMMNYYARGEQWSDAVSIAQKFVEKFPKHEQAGPVALKAGQWLVVAKKSAEAVAWFADTEKRLATSDKDMPGLLYWHAATLIQMQIPAGGARPRTLRNPDKIRELLQRVIYDYPRSDYTELANVAMQLVEEPK